MSDYQAAVTALSRAADAIRECHADWNQTADPGSHGSEVMVSQNPAPVAKPCRSFVPAGVIDQRIDREILFLLRSEVDLDALIAALKRLIANEKDQAVFDLKREIASFLVRR